MRVLVVEDDDAIADPLVEGLRREGFDVARVAAGADALEAPTPDVVTALGLAIVHQLAARNDACAELRRADPAGLDAVITLSARPQTT